MITSFMTVGDHLAASKVFELEAITRVHVCRIPKHFTHHGSLYKGYLPSATSPFLIKGWKNHHWLLIWPLIWPYWPMGRVAFEGGWAWNILRFYFSDGRSVWPYFFGGWLRKKLEIAKLSEVIWQAGTWTWTHEWRCVSYSTYPYHPCILVWITYIYSSWNYLHPPQIINQILVNIPYTDAMG